MKKFIPLASLLLIVMGCTAGSKVIKSFGKDHLTVDGVRLEYSREVEVEARLDDLLDLESSLGDIEIVGVDGDIARLRVEIYEYRPDDIELELTERGYIELHSNSRKPGAVGRVWAEVPRGLDLEIETGMGDVSISEMSGAGELRVDTGYGKVMLAELDGHRSVDVNTGKGDILLGPARELRDVELNTGMGSIKVLDSDVEDISTSTGMGGIRFLDCEFGSVSGGTGMGSVKFRRTNYEYSDISSGFGRVSGD